jgi:hypothetical protein
MKAEKDWDNVPILFSASGGGNSASGGGNSASNEGISSLTLEKSSPRFFVKG